MAAELAAMPFRKREADTAVVIGNLRRTKRGEKMSPPPNPTMVRMKEAEKTTMSNKKSGIGLHRNGIVLCFGNLFFGGSIEQDELRFKFESRCTLLRLLNPPNGLSGLVLSSGWTSLKRVLSFIPIYYRWGSGYVGGQPF
jgi:hypothetical protein